MAIVSIIVPCYNCGEYLSETLDSCLSQTFNDWECIIVNDGSTDETEMISYHYLSKDNRFKYIAQNNQGPSAARNNGIQVSTGNYILPLDGDDCLCPCCLQEAIAHFKSNPSAKIVCWDEELFGARSGIRKLPQYNWERFIWDNCIRSCSMFKRTDYDKTRGYDESMRTGLEDWDFWLSLLRKDDVIVHIDKALFRYRIRDVSMTSQVKRNALTIMRRIYLNHPEIYSQFSLDIISAKNESLMWQDAYFDCLNKLKAIQESKAYVLGQLFLKPFRWVKKFFKSKR